MADSYPDRAAVIWLRGAVLFFVFLCLPGAGWAQARSTWDGVYTPVQALRGQLDYAANCQSCHRANLSGYGGVLTGAYFMESWRDEGLDKVFGLMKRSMPRPTPGSLRDDQYIDIIAYILQFNHFPTGTKELTGADLTDVLVAGKEGPNAILEFGSLVTVSGCLIHLTPTEWVVRDGSAPVKTNDPEQSSGAELAAARERQSDAQVFELQDAGFFHPERSEGNMVEARGFLTKQPGGGKLFVTSIQTIGGRCANGR